MSRSRPQSGSSSLAGSLAEGILYGIALFLPIVLVVMHWDTIRTISADDLADLPVFTRFPENFETGMETAGELFRAQSIKFYQLTTRQRTGLSRYRDAPDPITSTWNREALELRLAEKFNRHKMERARRYLDYIDRYKSMACREMMRSGVPASLTLAQALLESNAGQSFLAREANNHFGVKCMKRRGYKSDGWIDDSDFYTHELAYDCVQRHDDHPWDRFEKYNSVADSYRRHNTLLSGSSRYNWMLDAYRTGKHYSISRKWFGTDLAPYYAAWAVGVQEAGYATGKRYGKKIALIIETYELWRLDYGVVMAVS